MPCSDGIEPVRGQLRPEDAANRHRVIVMDLMVKGVEQKMMLTRAFRTLVVIGALLLLADNSAAWACAVCFGAADSPMTQGMNMAILLMLGILACVATGFVMFFIRLFKLSRASVGRDLQVQRPASVEGSY